MCYYYEKVYTSSKGVGGEGYSRKVHTIKGDVAGHVTNLNGIVRTAKYIPKRSIEWKGESDSGKSGVVVAHSMVHAAVK